MPEVLYHPLWRRVAQRGLVTILLSLAAVAAIEGVSSLALMIRDARRAAPTRPKSNFPQAAYDSTIGWVGLPNLSIPNNFGPGLSLTTTADGMRIHRPVMPQLFPGERRAICSGDSFTYGSGVSDGETFCAVIEHEIPGLVTLNMAQRGFGIDQAYLWYRRDGSRYSHQLHLFAFIWNDFERMTLRSFWGYSKPILRLKDGRLVTENVPVPPWAGTRETSASSSVLAESRLVQLVQRLAGPSESAQLRRVETQIWDVAEAVFHDLARLNRQRGSVLVLVYLPAPSDLLPGPYDARRKKLADFSKRSGISLIDLTPEIRQLPADTLDWFFITPNALPVGGSAGHYTAAGHRWVATRLAEHLRAIPAAAAALPAPAGATR